MYVCIVCTNNRFRKSRLVFEVLNTGDGKKGRERKGECCVTGSKINCQTKGTRGFPWLLIRRNSIKQTDRQGAPSTKERKKKVMASNGYTNVRLWENVL